jgi:hypothetical protein
MDRWTARKYRPPRCDGCGCCRRPRETLAALLPLLKQKSDAAHRAESRPQNVGRLVRAGVRPMNEVLHPERDVATMDRDDLDAGVVESRADEHSSQEILHRIVVVGGGAAGLELVTKLGDRVGRRGRESVTLVECARTHLWKPLLHSVAAGSLDPGEYEVNYLAQAHWHGFHYRFGEMIGLDRIAKQVHLAATFDEEGRQIAAPRSIDYDTLVIAIGSETNDFGTPGVAKYAVPLETPPQAKRFNRRLVNACLRAQT